MSHSLSDLNKHLFAELDRLSDPALKGDALKDEVDRAKAITDISEKVIDAHNVHLDAVKLIAAHRGLADQQPAIISQNLRIQ